MSANLTLIAASDAHLWLVVVAFGMLALLMFTLAAIAFVLLGPWLQAMMAGCPITVLRLIGMQFRQVSARAVVRAGIMATQAGHPVPWEELQRAYLQGVDVEQVTLAYVQAMTAEKNWAFADLVDGARQQRLERMLEE